MCTKAQIQTHTFLMCASSSCRTVYVDRNSFNSLVLNVNPHLKHQRMLVAGTVAVNSTGLISKCCHMLVRVTVDISALLHLCCRDTDSTERHLFHARHPRTACTHHHALHPDHGVTVSHTHTHTQTYCCTNHVF